MEKSFSVESRQTKGWRRFFGPEKKRKLVLQNISFSLAPGEKLLIAGANGSGKTTILKMAGGFIRPDKGSVTIGDKPAYRADRSRLGLMLSTQLLYPMLTGYQNLEFSAYLFARTKVKEAVAQASEEWGLSDILHDTVGGYSNGQRTLLAMARATIHQPDFVLLDEPDAFLDAKNRDRLEQYFKTTKASALITVQQKDVLHWRNAGVLQL